MSFLPTFFSRVHLSRGSNYLPAPRGWGRPSSRSPGAPSLGRRLSLVGSDRVRRGLGLFRSTSVSWPRSPSGRWWLRGEISTALGQRAAHHLEQGIFAKGVRVVLILIAARYLKDALPNERAEGMASSPVSPFLNALGDGFTQAQLFIHPCQPEKTTV